MNFDFSPEERSRLEALDAVLASWVDPADFETRPDVAALRSRLLEAAHRLQSLPYIAGGDTLSGSRAFSMACSQKVAAFSPSLHLTLEMGIRLPIALLQTLSSQSGHSVSEPLLSGTQLAAVAFREATMNVVNDPIGTRAETVGNDIVLNGTKSWVVNAPIADVLLVAAAMADRCALYWVPVATPGVTIGGMLEPLGFDGAAVASVSFRECRISPSQEIGRFDTATVMQAIQSIENEILIASAVGLMKTSFEEAKNHAKTHRTGGKPIIAYQEVGFKLSEMLTQLQTAELLAYRTAWSIENRADDVDGLLLCAKVFCGEAAESVTGAALQILSAKGYFGPSASERAYRCAKFTQIAGTSTEIARVRIGDEALGYR